GLDKGAPLIARYPRIQLGLAQQLVHGLGADPRVNKARASLSDGCQQLLLDNPRRLLDHLGVSAGMRCYGASSGRVKLVSNSVVTQEVGHRRETTPGRPVVEIFKIFAVHAVPHQVRGLLLGRKKYAIAAPLDGLPQGVAEV